MTPPFGLMMFWLREMRMRPLWMSAMRRPRMTRTMLAVLVRVTVTLTTLNSVVMNLNSVTKTKSSTQTIVHDGLLEAQLNTVPIDQCGLNPVVLCLCRHVLKLEPWDLWEASG